MSGDRGVRRVSETVKTLTDQINKQCDEAAEEMAAVGKETLDKVDRVKKSIVNPLKDAQCLLDELLVDSNEFETEDEDVVPLASTLSRGE